MSLLCYFRFEDFLFLTKFYCHLLNLTSLCGKLQIHSEQTSMVKSDKNLTTIMLLLIDFPSGLVHFHLLFELNRSRQVIQPLHQQNFD